MGFPKNSAPQSFHINILFMPWYIYIAIKQLFPTGRRVPFFTVMSVIGVTLGVMVLVIVQCVMSGYGVEFREKMININGHAEITSSRIIYKPEILLAQVGKEPGVAAAMPFAKGMVMIQHLNHPAFPIIEGIDIERARNTIALEKFVKTGNIDSVDDDSVLLSSILARSIGAVVGSTIDIYTPLMLECLKNEEVLLPREVRVVGIFETGLNSIDSNAVLCSLRLMQELYGLGEGIHGISIKQDIDLDKLVSSLNDKLPPPSIASTWMEMNQDFLFMLKVEKTTMFFVMMFIILVASFTIMNSLMTNVVRKTREIGILHAMGGDTFRISLIFSFQGIFIGIIGTFLGITLGWIALIFRNDIITLLARITHGESAFVKFYEFAKIPVCYQWRDFLFISLFTILISTFAGYIPALRASGVKAAEALRNE